MCGRFTLTFNSETMQIKFEPDEPIDVPVNQRFNIAPTQAVPIIVVIGGRKIIKPMRWGLIPRWAPDESIGNRLINARAETIAEKNAFKNSFKHKRCLVPADGFYEWKRVKGKSSKQPVRYILKSKEPFAFAGLWDTWRNPETDEEIFSFTIITTVANELLSEIHDRMPVILDKEIQNTWLDPLNTDIKELASLLKPYPSDLMTCYEVSTAVNSPTHDNEQLILPLG
jgi:putative SOS response-associated peptidase YedK